MLVVTLPELLVVFFIGKQRIHVLRVAEHGRIRMLDPLHERTEIHLIVSFCSHGCTDGDEVLGVLREDDFVICKIQRLDESLSQF